MGEPESRYKRRSDAERYARFYSDGKKYRAVPSGEARYPWKLQRVEKPKRLGVLERAKRALEPSAKRGRKKLGKAVKKRVKKRVRKVTRKRKSPKRKTTKRKTTKRKRRRKKR